MRKVIFQMLVTLDGFFEGKQREIDWHDVDQEFNDYIWGFFPLLDTLLFGRVTYDMMADYWPSASALEQDPITAKWMNEVHKVVFSRTLGHVEWQNTHLVKTDPVAEVRRLKKLPGKGMAIFGSSDLSLPLLEANLIDEYHLFINPLLLGEGKRLFDGLSHRVQFKLLRTKVFTSGLVGLFYQPLAR